MIITYIMGPFNSTNSCKTVKIDAVLEAKLAFCMCFILIRIWSHASNKLEIDT